MNSTFFGELFHFGLYKRTQGKVIRQVTFFGLLVIFVAGAWQLRNYLADSMTSGNGWAMFAGISALGAWISYRFVNVPRFADFLIQVEGEFNKISWPSQSDLYKSVIVVIVVMIILAITMWAFDFFWQWFFQTIRIIRPGGGGPAGK